MQKAINIRHKRKDIQLHYAFFLYFLHYLVRTSFNTLSNYSSSYYQNISSQDFTFFSFIFIGCYTLLQIPSGLFLDKFANTIEQHYGVFNKTMLFLFSILFISVSYIDQPVILSIIYGLMGAMSSLFFSNLIRVIYSQTRENYLNRARLINLTSLISGLAMILTSYPFAFLLNRFSFKIVLSMFTVVPIFILIFTESILLKSSNRDKQTVEKTTLDIIVNKAEKSNQWNTREIRFDRLPFMSSLYCAVVCGQFQFLGHILGSHILHEKYTIFHINSFLTLLNIGGTLTPFILDFLHKELKINKENIILLCSLNSLVIASCLLFFNSSLISLYLSALSLSLLYASRLMVMTSHLDKIELDKIATHAGLMNFFFPLGLFLNTFLTLFIQRISGYPLATSGQTSLYLFLVASLFLAMILKKRKLS